MSLFCFPTYNYHHERHTCQQSIEKGFLPGTQQDGAYYMAHDSVKTGELQR